MTARSQTDGSDQRSFRRFLEWLDEGLDSGGRRYLEMHRRLVDYFQRKNCVSAADLADETLSRVARRLEEEGRITGVTPAHYCYIVARFVFLENQRQARPAISHPAEGPVAPATDEGAEVRTRLLQCLERCLGRLEPDERELILEYYRGERRVKIERRRNLAGRLGLTANAVTIRACRIRARLETCVTACAGDATKRSTFGISPHLGR